MKKKVVSAVLAATMVASMFSAVGCGSDDEVGKVYYLNFKPEQDEQWQELAAKYTEETGVEVTVVTAAEGTYEETLTAEIDKKDAPTLFQISGTTALTTWGDYCMDLSDSAVYAELTSDDFAVKDGDAVKGIAYVYEGYGIIVNTKLLGEAGYKMDDINSFDDLKKVAEDITANSETLGFSAFTSSGLDSSSSWRFSGHLANMPLYYEFLDDDVTSQPATIKGTYLDKLQNVWDLYINNATVAAADMVSATGDQAVEEFTSGKAVFYQNGTWAYSDVSGIGDENLGYLPIYFGVDDEKQGLCCGTENYWAVNSQASEADQQATLDFLEWVVTSDEGTTALAEEMGFVSPFKQAKDVDNVLCNLMNEYVADGCYNVSWAFNYTPNTEDWRAPVVSALQAYCSGDGDWAGVESAFVDGWAEQYELEHQ